MIAWWNAFRFRRSLLRFARKEHLRIDLAYDHEKGCTISINIWEECFGVNPPFDLGILFGLLVQQAELEGVSRIRFHYGVGKMYYRIQNVDYDMVPPTTAAMIDMLRVVARSSGATRHAPGRILIPFADRSLTLSVRFDGTVDDPYFDIEGFSGHRQVPIALTGTEGPSVGEGN